MFFLLAGIPFGIFALRVILKIITGLSILNTLMGWSDSLSDYYKARVKGTDITDGHLETYLFGVDVHAVQIDMDDLGIERDSSKKRMDYNGKEIQEKGKAGCIKNIDAVIKRLESKGKTIGKVCYLLDKKNKTIIFIDRRGNETVAIEIPLQRPDLDDAKQAEWNKKIEKILSMDSNGQALTGDEIDSIDELLTGFGADTCKTRTAAAAENAKAFVQSPNVSTADKAKVEYLLKALQEMQALQVQAVNKQRVAQDDIDKIKAGDFGVMDQARSLMASFDSTMDKYVDKAVTAVGKGFDRNDDGFFEYVTYLVEVAKFESGMATDREIAIQKAQAQAEHNGVVVANSSKSEQEGWQEEAWYQQGLAGKLESYKQTLEENLAALKEEQMEMPVAAPKPEQVGKPMFRNLFNSDSAKNVAKDKAKTQQAIQARKKQAIPISLFERFKRFFSSVFRPTPHMSIRALLLGDKVNDLGNNAVDTQFERENKLAQQKEALSAKIARVEARITTVKAIQGQVTALEKTVSEETVAVYQGVEKTKKDNAALAEKAEEKSAALAKLSDSIKPLDEIGANIEENSRKLSHPEGMVKDTSVWGGLEKTEQDTLSQLNQTYDSEHTRLEEQLSALNTQVENISILTESQKLALKEQQSQLEKVDSVNETIMPLAVRSAVSSFCAAAETAISGIQSSLAVASTKVDETKKKVDAAVKEAVVNTAMALLHEEASVSIFYTNSLTGLEPKSAEMAVAYDPDLKKFSYKYRIGDEVFIKKIDNMDADSIKVLLTFLNNQTPENKEKLLATPAFSAFKATHDEVLAAKQAEIERKEAADKAKIESKLGTVDLTQSGDAIMAELVADLSAEEGQTIGQRLHSLMGESNGKGAARLKELQNALAQLQAQKDAIDELTSSITQQHKTLDEIEASAAEASQLKQTLESYQIAQLQQQLRLAVIQVGSALNELKEGFLDAKSEAKGNQFFTQKDKDALRLAMRDAKRYAGKTKVMSAFEALKGTPIYEQLNSELSQENWAELDDETANSIIDRIEGFINAGLDSLESKRDSLELELTKILGEMSALLSSENKHKANADNLQLLINKAIQLSAEIQSLNDNIHEIANGARDRKEKAMDMLNQVNQMVSDIQQEEIEAKEKIRLQAAMHVQDFVERAEKAAANAAENATLLTTETAQIIATQAVDRAQTAAREAKEASVSTEGLEQASSVASRAAKTAEKESEMVIVQVVMEAEHSVEKLKNLKEMTEFHFKSMQSSIGTLSVVQQDFMRHGKEAESDAMMRRTKKVVALSNECAQALTEITHCLDGAEASLASLRSEKIAVNSLKQDIDRNVALATSHADSVAERKQEADGLVQDSLNAVRDLRVETKVFHLEKRKLGYVMPQEDNVVSPLISAEQQIASDMRARLGTAMALSGKMIGQMKESSHQIKVFAEDIEQAYSAGDFNRVKELYEGACNLNNNNKKIYKAIVVSLAVERACYMLLAKTEIFEAVHRCLKNEITVEEAQKIIAAQEAKVKNAEEVVNNLALLHAQGVQLYGQEFSSLLSELKCVKSDIEAYRQSLYPSEAKAKSVSLAEETPQQPSEQDTNPFAGGKEWYELAAEEVVNAEMIQAPAGNPFADMPAEKGKKWYEAATDRQFWARKNASTLFQKPAEEKAPSSPNFVRRFVSGVASAFVAFITDASAWVTALFESGGAGLL